jgi:phosphate acetyltransferase
VIGDKYHVKNRTLVMSQALDRNASILHMRKNCVELLAKKVPKYFWLIGEIMNARRPFFEKILTAAQKKSGCVIFPEGDDPRVIEAARLLLEWNAVKTITLLTNSPVVDASNSMVESPSDTRLKFRSTHSLDLIDSTRDGYLHLMAKKNKPVDPEDLKRVSTSALYQAGTMLQEGRADCVVAGCVATTGDVIRAALSTVGLAPGFKTVSGSFMMDRSTADKSETYIYADCGVVIEPTIEQLVDIAVSSCKTFQDISGQIPVVAFVSFSTKGSANHPRSVKMRDAAELFRHRMPMIDSDGELQFDAALIETIGRRKAPDSKVPGRANCFIFPDLDAGNIAYKITERLAGFAAYGPILQGLAKPYSDLSRGASAEDIAISALINIMRA